MKALESVRAGYWGAGQVGGKVGPIFASSVELDQQTVELRFPKAIAVGVLHDLGRMSVLPAGPRLVFSCGSFPGFPGTEFVEVYVANTTGLRVFLLGLPEDP